MEPFDWTCPFCERHTTITSSRLTSQLIHLSISNNDGNRFCLISFIICPNPSCRKFTLEASLYEEETHRYQSAGSGVMSIDYVPGKLLQQWRLIPFGTAKTYPDYIPKAILEDYREASLIADLSPKASATLARRALQGMIRDFWKVKTGRLVDEIEQIETQVDPLTWDAIEAIRKVGNIGAHMEKDVDVIIDVEPDEARLLIGLIELLLKEWYVNREERKKRLLGLKQLAADKQDKRKATKP